MIELFNDNYNTTSYNILHQVYTAEEAKEAFDCIVDSLKSNNINKTVCIKLNDSYYSVFERLFKNIKHVECSQYLPTNILSDKLNCRIPIWLDNELIIKFDLLNYSIEKVNNIDWEDWFLDCIFKSTDNIVYSDWVINAYKTDAFNYSLPNEVNKVFVSRLCNMRKESIAPLLKSKFEELVCESDTLHLFLEKILYSSAVHLIPEHAIPEKYDLYLAEHFDLVFPLPEPVNADVSNAYVKYMHKVRNDYAEHKTTADESIFKINALWDHIEDKLEEQVNNKPLFLSDKCVKHLQQLPYENNNKKLISIIKRFRPVVKPDPSIDWRTESISRYNEYSLYINNSFSRRDLPDSPEVDPSNGFCDWLIDNIGDIYNDKKDGFVYLSEHVKTQLKNKRRVVICMMDAFAYQLSDICIQYLSEALSNTTPDVKPMFTSLPTITEIAKNSVLTGLVQKNRSNSLEKDLLLTYGLDKEELLIIKDWDDIDRYPPKKEHKLIIYINNRIDEKLHNSSNYSKLRSQVKNIFKDVAEILKQWKEDLYLSTNEEYVYIITADHGFTYGPPVKDPLIKKDMKLHRCRKIEGTIEEYSDELTILNKEDLFLYDDYYAAKSHELSYDTISGWQLQHGGLLPEEVVVPVITFDNQKVPVYFLKTNPQESIQIVDNKESISLNIELYNNNEVDVDNLKISVMIKDYMTPTNQFINLSAGERKSVCFKISFNTKNVSDEQKYLNIIIQQTDKNDKLISGEYKIAIEKELMGDNQEFEEMF